MNALIIHKSRTGNTRQYAIEISIYLKEKGIDANVVPLSGYKNEMLEIADLVFLGSWTHGLFIIFQHPDKEWVEFVQKLPDLNNKKLALFTTYKLLTGTMFKKMKKHLSYAKKIELFLKSRNSKLSADDKLKIDNFAT